ncbi:hypothetical protein EJB05_22565, partial [Eragrostis curvula]
MPARGSVPLQSMPLCRWSGRRLGFAAAPHGDGPPALSQRWDALLVPEVVRGIHLLLHLGEPLEVCSPEVALPPHHTALKCADAVHHHVPADVKISVVDVRLPGILGHVPPHDAVKAVDPARRRRAAGFVGPGRDVLDVVQHAAPVRVRRGSGWDGADETAVRLHDQDPGAVLGQPGDDLPPLALGDGLLTSSSTGIVALPRKSMYTVDCSQVISWQSALVMLSSRKRDLIIGTSWWHGPRYKVWNTACCPSTIALTWMSSGRAGATRCHLVRTSMASLSNVFTMLTTVTVGGTLTRLTFHDTTMPKLPPPPPRIAQKRSSPMADRSRRSPLAFTSLASTTRSMERPKRRIIMPIPPPLKWPPTPMVVQTPAGNASSDLFLATW